MTTTTIGRILRNTIGTAMLAGALLMAPQAAQARVFVTFGVGIAPPVIPVYAQPVCPGDGYIWTPGYWAYTDDGYQWVDGAWVLAPYTGALWTPGYWAYGPSGYFWNAGYWGTTVGYYGGINYGFGYFGTGFYGGYWNHGAFFYNREYNRFGDRGFRNVYDQRVNGFDGRPGGASFARGTMNENRGGTFNNATNRNGFGQIGDRNNQVQVHNDLRIANNSNIQNTSRFNGDRSVSTGASNFNRTNDNFAGNRGGYHQPLVTRNEGNSFNGGFRGNAGGNAHSAPARSYHASAPAASSHGNSGGGGFHGGGRR